MHTPPCSKASVRPETDATKDDQADDDDGTVIRLCRKNKRKRRAKSEPSNRHRRKRAISPASEVREGHSTKLSPDILKSNTTSKAKYKTIPKKVLSQPPRKRRKIVHEPQPCYTPPEREEESEGGVESSSEDYIFPRVGDFSEKFKMSKKMKNLKVQPIKSKQVKYRNLSTMFTAKKLGLDIEPLEETEYDRLWEEQERKQVCEENIQPLHRIRCDEKGNRLKAKFGLDDILDPSGVVKGKTGMMPMVPLLSRMLAKKIATAKIPLRALGLGQTLDVIDGISRVVVALDKVSALFPIIIAALHTTPELDTTTQSIQTVNVVQRSLNEQSFRLKEILLTFKDTFDKERSHFGAERRAIMRCNKRNREIRIFSVDKDTEVNPIDANSPTLRYRENVIRHLEQKIIFNRLHSPNYRNNGGGGKNKLYVKKHGRGRGRGRGRAGGRGRGRTRGRRGNRPPNAKQMKRIPDEQWNKMTKKQQMKIRKQRQMKQKNW